MVHQRNFLWTVVVTQLVERLLPTPEVRSSNPVNCKLLYRTFVHCQLHRKDENKEKEAGNDPFKKVLSSLFNGHVTYSLIVLHLILGNDLNMILFANNEHQLPMLVSCGDFLTEHLDRYS